MPDSPGASSASTQPQKKRHRFGLGPLEWLVVCAIIAVLVALLLPPATSGHGGARREQCRNNLKQIALALHLYHDKYGSFPPAYVADENGRPMHSWRVLVLPFLDKQSLYDEYRFGEPWNGPNNSKLAEQRIDVLFCPTENRKDGRVTSPMTSYVAVVGPESVWPGEAQSKLSDITGGTDRTLLVVEVANSGIHWMEPRDLHVLQMTPIINGKSGQGISSAHIGGAHASFADGHVRFLSQQLPHETIKALLTRAGGETASEF